MGEKVEKVKSKRASLLRGEKWREGHAVCIYTEDVSV